MKNNKLEYPTEERRQLIRRQEDQEPTESETIDSEPPRERIFLTPGERKLLQDIYLSDLD
jgi:hypothetical protein